MRLLVSRSLQPLWNFMPKLPKRLFELPAGEILLHAPRVEYLCRRAGLTEPSEQSSACKTVKKCFQTDPGLAVISTPAPSGITTLSSPEGPTHKLSSSTVAPIVRLDRAE